MKLKVYIAAHYGTDWRDLKLPVSVFEYRNAARMIPVFYEIDSKERLQTMTGKKKIRQNKTEATTVGTESKVFANVKKHRSITVSIYKVVEWLVKRSRVRRRDVSFDGRDCKQRRGDKKSCTPLGISQYSFNMIPNLNYRLLLSCLPWR